MKTLNVVLTTLVVSGLVAGATGAGIIYSGAYNVAADDHHLDVTYWILNKARQRSVAAHSADIQAPELGGHRQLVQGAAHFSEMCTGCHVPPGGQMSEAAEGMYPQPPNLAESGAEMPARQIFWTLEHGIKASGMPAWGKSDSPEALWAVTALIKAFPNMSGDQYQTLVKEAKAKGIGEGEHSHGGHGDAHEPNSRHSESTDHNEGHHA
ncbi:c-type cytochrome [Salinisphaera hydrothermalis]|uniref:c-type cytochrome n=1 Tax=Salinisphaera hydrothermalis TaxID=563188 RepID=UPI00333E26EB